MERVGYLVVDAGDVKLLLNRLPELCLVHLWDAMLNLGFGV